MIVQGEVGKAIKKLRRSLGSGTLGDVTQKGLAVLLGVSRFSVNQLERGHQSLTVEMALKLERISGEKAEVWMDRQRDDSLTEARHQLGHTRVV